MIKKGIIAGIALALICVCFTACSLPETDTDAPDTGIMYLVIANDAEEHNYSVYSVELNGVGNVFDALDAAEVGYQQSGGFINAVDGITLGENEYIYLYTSVEKDFDVSQYALTLDWCGVTLTSSGLGASDMTLESGCIIYLGTLVY